MKDSDKMPFGIHKDKQMINVPASYLIWLYENDKCYGDVKTYIVENLDVLKSECPDDEPTTEWN